MKKQYVISVQGKEHTWAFIEYLTEEEAANLSRDGIDVGLIMYSIPRWVIEWKLATPYRIAVDIFNFRNPF